MSKVGKVWKSKGKARASFYTHEHDGGKCGKARGRPGQAPKHVSMVWESVKKQGKGRGKLLNT